MGDTGPKIKFVYRFLFTDGRTLNFDVSLDAQSLTFLPQNHFKPTRMSKLTYHQCPNCPFTEADTPYCPVAKNLEYILHKFKDIISYERVTVIVENSLRTYSSQTSVQHGLSSMMGLIMATSGCPILGKLKPMVRFHLPFSNLTETVFRAASTYLLGEFIKYRKGETPDWDMNKLAEIYRNIEEVNAALANRVRSLVGKDAHINALIALDIFAKEMPQTIQESLKEFEYLFNE